MHRLRVHSGESIESLHAELSNGAANTTLFDLNKLLGRALQQNLREYALGDQRLLQGPGDFEETLSGMISSAALFQHSSISEIEQRCDHISHRKPLTGSGDRHRPLSEEIAQIVLRCGLEIIVHHLVYVLPIHVHGRNLELPILLRQRFHIQLPLLCGQ
jgi:hypothetical protein